MASAEEQSPAMTADEAVEQSPFPGDSKPDQGPSLGEHCTTDRPSPSGEVPTGEISKLGDLEVYVTKPNDYPHSPSKLLLLLTSGTGIKSRNNQLQADKYAAEGFLVVMPDQFDGDPAPNSTIDPGSQSESEPSVLEQMKLGAAETIKSFQLDMWLARHTPEKVMPRLNRVIDSIKEEFADALAHGGGLYAVGYCFGGKYAMLLATNAEQTPETQENAAEGTPKLPGMPQVKAAAVAHGTMVTQEDIAGVRAPITLVCVENDSLFPQTTLDEGIKSLQSNQVEHEVEIFPNVPHGFAILGDYADKAIGQAQRKAFTQMLSWLQSH